MKVQLATDPPISFFRDVAVVGSSEEILSSSYGAEIDTHQEVIRFNRAVTDGVERQVGSRTTLRVVNFHTFQSFWPYSIERTPPDLDVDFCRKLRRTLIGVHSRKPVEDPYRCVDRTNRVVCIFPAPVVARINWILFERGIEVTFIAEPRVGFVTVILLVDSGIEPHLYGFGVDEGKVSTRKYWWKEVNSNRESIYQEAAVLRSLESRGRIHVHR